MDRLQTDEDEPRSAKPLHEVSEQRLTFVQGCEGELALDGEDVGKALHRALENFELIPLHVDLQKRSLTCEPQVVAK
jgi:hypothetical protein